MKFIYWDNSKIPPVKLMEVEAVDILEADKKFQETTGINPIKPFIGVQVFERA